MAQPNTETPALRLVRGSPRPIEPTNLFEDRVGAVVDVSVRPTGATTCGRKKVAGKMLAARAHLKRAMSPKVESAQAEPKRILSAH